MNEPFDEKFQYFVHRILVGVTTNLLKMVFLEVFGFTVFFEE